MIPPFEFSNTLVINWAKRKKNDERIVWRETERKVRQKRKRCSNSSTHWFEARQKLGRSVGFGFVSHERENVTSHLATLHISERAN